MGKKKRNSKKLRKKRILADHQQKGKTFIPPFLATLGNKLGYIRWTDDLLPEMLWIALLFDSFPERRAVEIAEKCAQETKQVLQPKKARSFAFISEYDSINPTIAKEIREVLSKEGVLEDLQVSLYPLVSLYPKCPLNCFYDEEDKARQRGDVNSSLYTLKRVVSNCFDRRGRPAMIVQATAVYLMIVTGKMIVPKGTGLEKINDILDYPKTDESQKLGASVRASLNVPIFNESESRWWCSYFWQHGYEISICEFPKRPSISIAEESKYNVSKLLEAAQLYRDKLLKEIKDCWNRVTIDLSKPLRDEVLGALIARQARFATVIVTEPQLWSLDISRILLRCMVDTHITLLWLATKGTYPDFENFVEYGLGQEKLLLEHIKSRLDKSDPESHRLRENVEGMESWIDSQFLTYLLPVNVGSWTKKTTRQMAEETGCPEIFNLSYAPFSSVLHGTWNAISRLNLEFCSNPLHRFHRVPSLEEPPIHLGTPEQAIKIMDESFRAWKQAKGIDMLSSVACDSFLQTVSALFNNN